MNQTPLLVRIVVLFGLLLFFVAGCSRSVRTYPVNGQVFWKGKPAAGAVVFFHPVEDQPEGQNVAKQRRPTGTVQEDGKFQLSTFGIKDGAPVGQYRVSIVWSKNTGKGDDAVNELPVKFMSPATSGLPIIDVREQPNELAAFQLVP